MGSFCAFAVVAIQRASGIIAAFDSREEGKWALPHGEFGLDVIALVGSLRYTAHRSIPEIHRDLRDPGVSIAERTVIHLLERYEEWVTFHLTDQRRLRERFQEQGQIILAIDGLQPDVGREVLWVLRDCFSGEVLLARSLYLPEAAKPLYEADRHAKKELKKHLRGIRPIERTIEWCSDAEAEAIRGYCLTVRSALTDDGKPRWERLAEMEQAPIPSEPLAAMLSTFRPRHRQSLARPLS